MIPKLKRDEGRGKREALKEPMIQENHSLNVWERQATSNKGLMKTKQRVDVADREMKEGG
jgi:hypothetical protein